MQGTLTLKFTFWITCWGSLSRITLHDEREARGEISDMILPSAASRC